MNIYVCIHIYLYIIYFIRPKKYNTPKEVWKLYVQHNEKRLYAEYVGEKYSKDCVYSGVSENIEMEMIRLGS